MIQGHIARHIDTQLTQRTTDVAALSMLLGALCSLGFAPHQLWWLPPLCLAVWLHTVLRLRRAGAVAASGLAFGAGLFFSGMSWLFAGVQSHSAAALAFLAPAALLLSLAVQAMVAALLIHRFRERPVFALLVCAPSAWMAMEWLQHHGEIPVPWLTLGYTQMPDGWLRHWAPVAGVLGVSAAIVLSAGLMALLLRRTHRATALKGLAAWLLACTAVSQAAPTWTIEQPTRVRVSLLQASFAGSSKFEGELLQTTLRTYDELARASDAQIIVMPETAWPTFVDRIPAAVESGLIDHARTHDADIVVSHLQHADDGIGYHSVARVIGTSGEQLYRKRTLMPFGDYVPYPALYRRAYEAITRVNLLDTLRGPDAPQGLLLAGHRFALRMCYESLFGHRHRDEVASAGAIFELANDDWFDHTTPLHQHLQIAQARALESGRSVLRAANTGITAWITPDGVVQRALPIGATGSLDVTVPLRSGVTPYVQYGDALPMGTAGLAMAGGLLLPVGRRRTEARQPSHHQQGQALPVGLFFLFICLGLMLFMFNSGQTVTEKMRVTNAADMAAYSVGIEEARALNYDAYVNRTIVANQIAIAQILSLQSWLHYFDSAVDLAPVTSAYVIRYFTLPSSDSLEAYLFAAELAGTDYLDAYTGGQALTYTIQVTDYVAPIHIAAHNAAAYALAATQEAVHASLTLGISQRSLANDIVKAIDPTLDAEIALLSYDFDGFTKRYAKNGSGGDERGRLADVVTRSRDDFTRDRSWTLHGASLYGVQKDVAMKKRGGTELVNYDEWKAMDTLEGHARGFGCGKYGLSWCSDDRITLGYGAAQAGTNGGSSSLCGKLGGSFCGGQNIGGSFGGAYAENPRTAGRADQEIVDNGNVFQGLPSSRDLANVSASGPQTTGITVMVSKATGDVAHSGGASNIKPTGRLQLFDATAPGNRMVALSRAEIYFERPVRRADGREELANLYNPYWSVRLVAPTAADKLWAAAQQGGTTLP